MTDEDDVLVDNAEGRLYGKYRAKVVDNNDPDHRGQLLVTASVLDKLEVWALPCVPYAGKGRGMLFLPEVGTQVWLEFEAGDPSVPIWSGCFWNKDDLAPADHAPHIKLIKTEKLEIRIDDAANSITISNSFGTILEIKDGKLVGKANTEIVHQVAGAKTALNTLTFEVHDGALGVSS
ncbi:MAG: phage baseplate assembly protein V [Enhygromyxa sp.]